MNYARTIIGEKILLLECIQIYSICERSLVKRQTTWKTKMTKVRLGTAGVHWCRVTVSIIVCRQCFNKNNCIGNHLVQSIKICLSFKTTQKWNPNDWLNYDGNKHTLLKLGIVREIVKGCWVIDLVHLVHFNSDVCLLQKLRHKLQPWTAWKSCEFTASKLQVILKSENCVP